MNYSELNQGRSDTSNEIIETDMTLDEPTDTRLTPPTSNKDNNQCPLLDLTDLPNSPCSGSTYRNMSPISSPKPRLIRSNSYTLEAPSPMLLAHLEKCNKLECQGTDERSEVNCRNVSSFENTYVPFENSEFNSLNTVYNVNTSKADDPEEVVEILSPRIEVIQTDISVQQITVNGNKDSATENDFDFSDHDCQLIRVLRKIPENYSKQIIELIEKQRKEKLSKAESLRKIEKQFLDEFSKKDLSLQENVERNESNTSDRIKTPYDSSGRPKTGERSYSTTTLSPSQSLSYSVSSSNDTLVADSPSIKLIHFEYEGGKANESERFVTADKSMDDLQSPRVPKDNSNFSRELFPRLCDGLDLESLKQDWAARVIGAHVRGYLTRRLLRTERVQSLIETIKDALLCALQLHNADNIDESDVELHRRLINQVSAACYAFHDIFFSLSLPEQMSVIAVDRHRKIEKAKRPISAPVSGRSRSNSSQSSARSHAKQSQSLTKV
ncbi:hypothetical protein JTB14_013546 [Gonioctena quinquepunctata]|nr:hypothetical protein JTB14_013546 [Gonioctena quinquepunctata]